MHDSRNFYGEAIEALEQVYDSDDPQVKATVASAKASLALFDGVIALRNVVEDLPGRLRKNA